MERACQVTKEEVLLWIGQAAEVKECATNRSKKKDLQCPGASTLRLLLGSLARMHKRTTTEGRTNTEIRDVLDIIQTTTNT